MDDYTTLYKRARELIRLRRVPAGHPVRVWGGLGTGRDPCLVCGKLLRAGQTILRAEFEAGTLPISQSFHARCFWALEFLWRPEEEGSKIA